MSYDETYQLDTFEWVSRSVVNTSTAKLVYNIFYQAVPVGGMGSCAIVGTSATQDLFMNSFLI